MRKIILSALAIGALAMSTGSGLAAFTADQKAQVSNAKAADQLMLAQTSKAKKPRSFNPQPEPPGKAKAKGKKPRSFNPQPEPPGKAKAKKQKKK